MKIIKIFIDPGHGGRDPGAVANGLREKDLVLIIAKALKKYLEQYENVEVKLSREDDHFLTLKQRTDMANAWGATIFISIHVNAGGGIGFESFIWNGSVSAATISNQNVIHAEIMKQIGGRDRGKKRANFAVVRESRMPALLTEAAFIDNDQDAARLKDPGFLDSLALGHANGIVKVFGLKKKPEPKPAPATEAPIYRVSINGKQIFALREKGNIIRQLDQHIGTAKEIKLERI